MQRVIGEIQAGADVLEELRAENAAASGNPHRRFQQGRQHTPKASGRVSAPSCTGSW